MKNNNEKITFYRGGDKITMFKSPNLFTVKLKKNKAFNNSINRLPIHSDLNLSVRFMHNYPGKKLSVFHCPGNLRDDIMKELRLNSDVVQYCSHVLLPGIDEDLPLFEIGLDNKIYIVFCREPAYSEINTIENTYGLRAIWNIPENPANYVFELTEHAKSNPVKITRELLDSEQSNLFKVVEPCLIEVKHQKAIPTNQGFRKQWHLYNDGSKGGKPGADCNVIEAWDYTWGNPDIAIAVIDDGFDLNHPDFSFENKIKAPYDASEYDNDPSPLKYNNHGTACAGIAVACRNKGMTVGVAPDCSIIPIRHYGRVGDYEEALAFFHAYQNKADIISCSWGPLDAYLNQYWPMPQLTQDIIRLCATKGRNGKGIPIFFAAGNGKESVSLDGYASNENVIAVAASTHQDNKADYSDYGEKIWITAPSSGDSRGIFTTDRMGIYGYDYSSDYTDSFGGTSASAPMAAGVAALMLSVNPELTVQQVKEILKDTAVKINKNNPNNYIDKWGNKFSDKYDDNGHSQVYGWGRINAGKAVKKAFSKNSKKPVIEKDYKSTDRLITGDIFGKIIFPRPQFVSEIFGIAKSPPQGINVDIVVNNDEDNSVNQIGYKVKKAYFDYLDDNQEFIFNVCFACCDPGEKKYVDPDSHWFNVFFGFYQIEVSQESWGRPFAYKDGKIIKDEVIRLGKADWNHFSNHMYGVPEKYIKKYTDINQDIEYSDLGREKINNKYWDLVELRNVEVVSAYCTDKDGKKQELEDRLINKFWKSFYVKPNNYYGDHVDGLDKSFFPVQMTARLYMCFNEGFDIRLGKTFRTFFFGGTKNQYFETHNKSKIKENTEYNNTFLNKQIKVLKNILNHRKFAELGFSNW